MFYSKLILLAALAASAVPATLAWGRRKSRCTAKNPRTQTGRGRCPDGQTVPELLECSSGSGFNRVRFDFNILREIVIKLGVGSDLEDLASCTLFMPTDLGLCVFAQEAGFYGGHCSKRGFNEEAVFDSLVGSLTEDQLSDILSNHIVLGGAYGIYDLYGRVVTTSLGEDLTFEGAKPQNCPDRVRIIDEGRKESILQNNNNLGGYAKAHNQIYDVKLAKGCKAHAIKNVLLPEKTLQELGVIQ